MAEEIVVLVAGEVHLADDSIGLANVVTQNLINVLGYVELFHDASDTVRVLSHDVFELLLSGFVHTFGYLFEVLHYPKGTIVVHRCYHIPRKSWVSKVLLDIFIFNECLSHHLVVVIAHDEAGFATSLLESFV